MATLRCFTYILHLTVDRCQYSSAPERGRHIEQTLESIHTGGLVLALGIEVQLTTRTACMLGRDPRLRGFFDECLRCVQRHVLANTGELAILV